MKRKNLTRNEVFEVWQALRTGNRPVSGLDVREKPLGGSLTTIYKFLREFEAAEKAPDALTSLHDHVSQKLEISKERLETGTEFLKSFGASITHEATTRFAEKESQFAQALEEQKGLLSSKEQEYDRLLTELEQEEKRNELLEAELSKTQEVLLKGQTETQVLREQFSIREKDFKAHVSSQASEIEALRKESNLLREKTAIIGEFQALKVQFEIREKEFKERIVSKEKEITELRHESNLLRERAVAAEAKLSILQNPFEKK